MSARSAGLGAWWLRFGGGLLIASCVVSWLLPLPPWAHFLWNMLVALGCVHLLALHRKRGGNGGRREP